MWRIALIVAAGILTPMFCQESVTEPGGSTAMEAPALPHFDWDVCPFETCVYREWTARSAVFVYDTWDEKRQPVARLAVGDKVTGVTGVVITFRPGTIRVDRDLPDEGFKRGDTILTYVDRGEGFSAVWFKGRYHPDFDISFAKLPDGTGCGNEHCAATYIDLGKKSWWAQVKLSSGRLGWVQMDTIDFEGVDRIVGLDDSAPLKQFHRSLYSALLLVHIGPRVSLRDAPVANN
jgi:hypothetical protein